LNEVALSKAHVAIPHLPPEKSEAIELQLAPIRAKSLHEFYELYGEPGLTEIDRLGLNVKTMGRAVSEDQEFFLASSSAGALALKLFRLRTTSRTQPRATGP
jgi:hypothetical protein